MTRISVNGYLAILVLALSFMVIDQARALRHLSDYVKLQDQTIVDYWNAIQNCKK